MKQDRLLWIILGGTGLLVILAVVLFFSRSDPQEYVSDQTPEGVVRNYLLALQQGDYARAYGYIQESEQKPTLAEFQRSFLRTEQELWRTAVQLGAVEILDQNARVTLTIIHSSGDPFNSVWNETTAALLVLQDGEWEITSMPYPYWGWEWIIEK
jgi:hypothetical protein